LRNGGTIRRVSINGGDVIDIGPGSFPGGAAWSTDNTIVFAGPADGLWRISANGGTPEALTKLDPDADVAHTRPQFLSGNRILFTIRRKSGKAEFAILDNGATRVVAPGGDNGRFVASGLGDGVGHLVFGRDETLFALPFDINRLEAVGVETPVVERVARNGPRWMFDYTVSADGWLVYSRAQAEDEVSLAWIESSGATTPVATQTLLGRPRLSPDARQAAGLLIGEGDRADIAVVDLTRGTTTRLTSAGANRSPVWTPDGRRIVFGGAVDQTRAVYVTEADGSTAPRQLFTTAAAAQPMAISPDGRTLVYAEQMRLWLRALDGSGQSRPLHESPPGFEIDAHLSPDGKWIVYTADDTGRGEAYMHEFPGPGRRERVSTNGAVVARWVDGGRAIVYWDNSGQSGNLNVMRVPVQPGPAIKLQSPLDVFSQGAAFAHDVTADGSRFLGFAVKDGRPTTLVLVTGWFEELRARAPMAAR
jgi:serine/threonine-protein kinase